MSGSVVILRRETEREREVKKPRRKLDKSLPQKILSLIRPSNLMVAPGRPSFKS